MFEGPQDVTVDCDVVFVMCRIWTGTRKEQLFICQILSTAGSDAAQFLLLSTRSL